MAQIPLQTLLDARGMTHKNLAVKTGLHIKSISQIVNARRYPWAKSRKKIAAALGVDDPDDIVYPTRTDALLRKTVELQQQYVAAIPAFAAECGIEINPDADEGRRDEAETRRLLELDARMVDDAAFEQELERRLRNKAFVKALAQRLAEEQRAAS